MKLLERWESKDGFKKLKVRHWGLKRWYYYHPQYGQWYTANGSLVHYAVRNRLSSLIEVSEVMFKTQIHQIAFEKLGGRDEAHDDS